MLGALIGFLWFLAFCFWSAAQQVPSWQHRNLVIVGVLFLWTFLLACVLTGYAVFD